MNTLIHWALTLALYAAQQTNFSPSVPKFTVSWTATPTQAILKYRAPDSSPCTAQVWDMQRNITIASATNSAGTVTVTTKAYHGLLTGANIYIENSGVAAWDGSHTNVTVLNANQFTFASASGTSSTGGNVGVLVDDVNTGLYSGSNLDSRAGSVTNGQDRQFVIGFRAAPVALDGARYSRALQANARHLYALSCTGITYSDSFTTKNPAVGNTYNDGLPWDRSAPGVYAYPTIQWTNNAQVLIDPLTGYRTVRSTWPNPQAGSATNYNAALDPQSAWTGNQNPLTNTGTTATFTGPCGAGLGACPLVLVDTAFSTFNGTFYNLDSASLDWVQITLTNASISGTPTGDDAKITVCLTINGVAQISSCKDQALTATPSSYTLGTTNAMDLWQTGVDVPFSAPDANTRTVAVSYNATTHQATRTGNGYFNPNLTAGSCVSLAGTPYTVASFNTESLITLSPTNTCPGGAALPVSNTSGNVTGSNFGVIIFKKTQATDTVSLGYTTFKVGTSAVSGWPAATTDTCSHTAKVVGGISGVNCFFGSDLYWTSADGTILRDLGLAQLYNDAAPNNFSQGHTAVPIATAFDPQDPDTWYYLYGFYNFTNKQTTIVKIHYNGDHVSGSAGVAIPDCARNGNTAPCLSFTVMLPIGHLVEQDAYSFNPDLGTSGFTSLCDATAGCGMNFAGVSDDGVLSVYAWTVHDGPGWTFLYDLGDRTPVGTDSGSMKLIAAASTYRVSPASYCSMHSVSVPEAGWEYGSDNDLYSAGAASDAVSYSMTMTGSMSGTAGACPPNNFGASGNNCTTVTTTGQPTSRTSATLNLQLGDVMEVDSEFMRNISITSTSPLTFVVQRAYYGGGAIAAHSTLQMNMMCGTINANGARRWIWNYRNDPYGLNIFGNTLYNDTISDNAHGYDGNGASINAAGALGYYFLAGNYFAKQSATRVNAQANPQFAGQNGFAGGTGGSDVEEHPGPISLQGTLGYDGRPMLGLNGTASGILATSGSPFVNVSGQLWKITGANAVLRRKIFATMAYVGNHILADVSGPGSLIGNTSADSYKYCLALLAGECFAGSSAGDLYVNAPVVGYPYCHYIGTASQPDDTTPLCIADLGANTGDIVEMWMNADTTGLYQRKLGDLFTRWNQQYTFWNVGASPSATAVSGYSRWLGGVRHEILTIAAPPMPQPDGVDRTTFIPITLNAIAPQGLGVASVKVEFGYAENGNAFWCTSRQDVCAAVGSTVNTTTPFYWASETYSGLACATSCAPVIPALSGRILYYRLKYLDSGGSVVSTDNTQVVAVN